MKDDHERGVLRASPEGASAGERRPEGASALGLGNLRDGIVVVPPGREGPVPLVIMLHGAGATASDVVPMIADCAERHGAAILAPDSRGPTWDMLQRGYGPDVAFLDRALDTLFAALDIDPTKIAIAGFSDGASYAISLGLTNGRLFSDILAFSPGFAAPTRTEDAPRIFVSHGREDPVLPIGRCGRRVAAALEEAAYDVDYREFVGGHVVPLDMVEAAFTRFLGAR